MADADATADNLDAILIGGRESGSVVIADYDPRWPIRFAEERHRIRVALGDRAKLVEHIGSTAVPGLAAKPIVDILVAVDDVDDEAAYGPALEATGYVLRVREQGHRMYRTVARDVHVHVWTEPGEVERHLRFRDRLREDENGRTLYESAKRDLAVRPWSDTNEYAQAKSAVIAEISRRARPEGGLTGADVADANSLSPESLAYGTHTRQML